MRKKTKKKGKAFERFRFVTAWPRVWVGRTGISLCCFASSSCGGLVGNVEKAWRKAEVGWIIVSSQATAKGAGLVQGRVKRQQYTWGKIVALCLSPGGR